jgi:hypothetical protein
MATKDTRESVIVTGLSVLEAMQKIWKSVPEGQEFPPKMQMHYNALGLVWMNCKDTLVNDFLVDEEDYVDFIGCPEL